MGIYAVSTLEAPSTIAKGPPFLLSCVGHPSEKPSFEGPQSSSSFPLRGQSQFPDSLVEVLTWLWAAVWGREAGQMSRSPGEEAAPWEGGQGFWPGKTTASPFDLALSVCLEPATGPS